MTKTRSLGDQVWTDLSSPSKEEVDSLVLAQNIDPIIAKDLLSPTPKQYVKEFDNTIYAVLHIPSFKHSHADGLEQEIDFIITKKDLVTARYDSIDALHLFAKQMEVKEILNKNDYSHLFFGIMKEVYGFLFNEIDYIKDWIKEIEKKIFEGREKEMVFSISSASRNILSFKRIMDPHQGVLFSLGCIGKNIFGEEFEKESKLLLEEWQRLNVETKNVSDMLDELRETNNSMLSTKQNEIMKQLAILGSILLPLTIIGQLFGLSVRSFPLMNHPYAFWIILSLMAVVMLISVIYAKIKKWM